MIQEIAPKSLIMLIMQKVQNRMILCLFFVDMENRMTKFCAVLKMEKLCFPPAVNWGVKSIYYNIYFRLMKPVIFFICRGFISGFVYIRHFFFSYEPIRAFAEMTRYTLALPV